MKSRLTFKQLLIVFLVSVATVSYAGESIDINKEKLTNDFEECILRGESPEVCCTGGVFDVGTKTCKRFSKDGSPISESDSEDDSKDETATANECVSEYKSAKKVCSPGSIAGMSDGDSAMFENILQQGGQMGGSLSSIGKGINEQCSMAQKLNVALSGTNAAIGTTCLVKANSCYDTCKKVPTEEQEDDNVGDARRACRDYQQKAAMMIEQAKAFASQAVASTACVKLTKDAQQAQALTLPPPSSLTDFDSSACTGAAASDPACVCNVNPAAPMCLNGLQSNLGAGGISRNADAANGSSRGLGSSSGSDDDLGMGSSGFPVGAGSGGGARNPSGGGGGSGGGLAGGVQALGQDQQPGKGSNSPSITTGPRGGSGGFSLSGGGATPGATNNRGGAPSDKLKIPNLKWGKLGGVQGDKLPLPGEMLKDGVTGANGLTIFEKVTRRYKALNQTFY